MKRNVEILAPAGSWESLKAAVCAGADAVYIGGSRFGARAYADNLTEDKMLEAIDYVHLHGRKLYLTVNTLLKEDEMEELYDYLLPYYKRGLDAVIVQDIGVLSFIRDCFPDLPLHVSTQATVTGAYGAQFFEKMGAERIVPARELSLPEIQAMKEQTGLEIECFVHGAMCYCYSGQCLLSSMIGGRSGNRWQCAQPCRLPYSVGTKKPKDLMSLKDMCTVELLPELIDAGIDSFKIEGRMKQPEYVYTVTRMYRKYADLYLKKGKKGFRVTEEDKKKLENAYRRRGYSKGYYEEHNGKDMISFGRLSGENDTETEAKDYKIKVKINGNLILSEGNRATLCLSNHDDTVFVNVEGDVVQTAISQPLGQERIDRQMRKTGNTEFEFAHLDIMTEGNVFLPMQALNELRREGMEELKEALLKDYRRGDGIRPLQMDRKTEPEKAEPVLQAYVQRKDQLAAILENDAFCAVYIDDGIGFEPEILSMVREAKKQTDKRMFLAMPYIFRQTASDIYEKIYGTLADHYDGVLIRNWESYEWLCQKGYRGKMIADANMYVFNMRAKKVLAKSKVSEYTFPEELNYRELRSLGGGAVLSVYGYHPVMITANCIRKTTGTCTGKEDFLFITDRYKKKFGVKNCCKYCYNVIYNSSPLVLLDQGDEIEKAAPSALRLDFTVESKEETARVADAYRRVFIEKKSAVMPEGDYTRGHFKRGVK